MRKLLEPVRASYRSGESLQWTRVNQLPDFVYFNHSIHINKGVGCNHLPRTRGPDAVDVSAGFLADGVVSPSAIAHRKIIAAAIAGFQHALPAADNGESGRGRGEELHRSGHLWARTWSRNIKCAGVVDITSCNTCHRYCDRPLWADRETGAQVRLGEGTASKMPFREVAGRGFRLGAEVAREFKRRR